MGSFSKLDTREATPDTSITVALIGGSPEDTDKVSLFRFDCTGDEVRAASARLRSVALKRIETEARNNVQKPFAMQNVWVSAMIAVVNALTIRARTPARFDEAQERIVKDGLSTILEEAVTDFHEDDELELYLSRETDIYVRVISDLPDRCETIELGNVNKLVAFIASLGEEDQPASVH